MKKLLFFFLLTISCLTHSFCQTENMWYFPTSGFLSTIYWANNAQMAYVDGTSTTGDGGQGFYNWDAASTATPDAFSIIQVVFDMTTVTDGRWIRRPMLGAGEITDVGTIGTGVWNGTTIGYQYGGTGFSTLGTALQQIRVNAGETAFEYFTSIDNGITALTSDVVASGSGSVSATIQDNAVDGSDISLSSEAQGAIMYYNGTDWVVLGPGTDGQMLETNGAAANPQWSTVSGGGQSVQIDTFTTSRTWTKPSGAKLVHVICIGSGGGGGSGRKGAAGSVRGGGGGGAAGGRSEFDFIAGFLPGTVSVTVGAPGIGGASQTTNSTNGNVGGAGNYSAFGGFSGYLRAFAGGGGGAGSTSGGAAGGAAASGNFALGNSGTIGAASSSSTISNPTASSSSGGGGGGGITTGNTNTNSSASSGSPQNSSFIGIAGTNGSAGGADTAGGAGSVTSHVLLVSTGGGGGGSSLTGNGGAGGAGAMYGSGGGGGGAAVDSVGNSGAGGNGGGGFVIVITYF